MAPTKTATLSVLLMGVVICLSSLYVNVKQLDSAAAAQALLYDAVAAVAQSADDLSATLHDATSMIMTTSDSLWKNDNASLREMPSTSGLATTNMVDNNDGDRPTIGYFVSMLTCGKNFKTDLFDSAAVLKRSIELNSYPLNPNAKYRASINALVLARVKPLKPCIQQLEAAGYNISYYDRPLVPSDIKQGTVLSDRIETNGCCGTKELVKLQILQREEYPVVVHLDFDTMLLNPLDELFDTMIHSSESAKGKEARVRLKPLVTPTYKYTVPLENMTIDAFYTRDYNGMTAVTWKRKVGVQGGFLVFRPNRTKLTEMVDLIKQGNFTAGRTSPSSGWFDSGYGSHIVGSMTIQGFLAYYFSLVAPDKAVELHRCKFNQAADNPRLTNGDSLPRNTPLNATAAGYRDGSCKDRRSNCDDVQCQSWPISDSRILHFTGGCHVPWKCSFGSGADKLNHKTCGEMHKAWMDLRHELDPSVNTLNGKTFEEEVYRGYCTKSKPTGYIRMHQNNADAEVSAAPAISTSIEPDRTITDTNNAASNHTALVSNKTLSADKAEALKGNTLTESNPSSLQANADFNSATSTSNKTTTVDKAQAPGVAPATKPKQNETNTSTAMDQANMTPISKSEVVQVPISNHTADNIPTIGYFISLFTCGKDFKTIAFDSAAVLKRSIELNAYPLNPNAKYRASVNAIVLDKVVALNYCTRQLKAAGYNILYHDRPLVSTDIKNKTALRSRIDKDGCCGIKELMKLYVLQREEYPIVVHLDFDTMLQKPLDELFDAMMHVPNSIEGKEARQHLRPLVTPNYKYTVPLENMTIDAFYTRDYNGMTARNSKQKVGLQGGFLVFRPNRTKFTEMMDLIKEGNFTPGRRSPDSGWFESGYGSHIFGSMTIQGFLAYYFSLVTPDEAVELHRCKFNQAADNPRLTLGYAVPRNTPLNATAAGYHDGPCKDRRSSCDDVQCQSWPISDSRLLHFTGGCRLPWACSFGRGDDHLNHKTCGEMHKAWMDMRHELDPSVTKLDNTTFDESVYRGYCKTPKPKGYIFMNQERVTATIKPSDSN